MDFEDLIYPNGGLNMDAAVDALPKGDYPYALDIRHGEYGTVGMITNREGSEEVVILLPSGTNKVIGYVEDKEDFAGYYFVYNSNGDHCIVRYFAITELVEFLLDSESVLNFQLGSTVHANIIGSSSNKLLCWTDDSRENPPRKLNIARAYLYTNPTTTTTTTTT